MMLDWCPSIRQACNHWRDAPMLQQTFEAMVRNFEQNNDACIDCAKTVVEVVCRIVVDGFHNQKAPLKPVQENPSLSLWLSSAIRALKLGDVRDDRFQKLVSSHYKLADALNDLRNKAGPASHGKDPYLERLAEHHRRSAVLAADAIVAFLYNSYIEARLDPVNSREPWECFAKENMLIDAYVRLAVDLGDDNGPPTLRFLLPYGDELPINIEVSRLLYELDRTAYVEALNAARGAQASITASAEEKGEP
jgi:hypothetical protein